MKNVIRCKDYSKRKVPPPYSGAGEAAAMLWKDGHLRMKNIFSWQVVQAHDGCLGDGGRRRTRQAAIVRGKAQAAYDPRVSEWSNPVPSGTISG